jgi:hypothetical protein
MSSQWLPGEMGAFGIADEGGDNALAGANHVYFYYCSSDNWAGQGTSTLVDPAGAGPSFTMFKHGHSILSAGVAALREAVVGEGGWVMPDLDEADRVILNGTSAGTSGVRTHADWLTDTLSPNGTDVRAIFDAANDPDLDALPEPYRSDAFAVYEALWTNALATTDTAPFVDTSCAAADDESSRWLCSVDALVIRQHVTTPFFVRQDLRDYTALSEYLDIPEDTYEALTRDALRGLSDVRTYDGEGSEVVPGTYGPNCAQHVALETNAWWLEATVAQGNARYTFQDAFLDWYDGAEVAVIDEPTTGEGDGPLSACVTVDETR